MGASRHLAVCICLCAFGCAQANIGDNNGLGPDGGTDPVVPRPTPDAAPQADAAPIAATLTQSTARDVVVGNSVSCNNGDPEFLHTDNSYYRVYDPAASGISTDFEVTSVDVAIESAISAGGTQSVSVFIYSMPAAPAPGTELDMTQFAMLGSVTTDLADVAEQVVNLPVTATVPAGTALVVEFFTPNGQQVGNRVFIGSNNLGQSGDSYIRAGDCGITNPRPTDQLGVAGLQMHVVLDVLGNHF